MNILQIEMAVIWYYEPGRLIPHIDFKMEWKGEGNCSDGVTDVIVTGALSEPTIKLRTSGLICIEACIAQCKHYHITRIFFTTQN